MAETTGTIVSKNEKTEIIKRHLRWAALFLGELRDGLTMVRRRIDGKTTTPVVVVIAVAFEYEIEDRHTSRNIRALFVPCF
jgi:hypothetical protein